MFSDIQKDLGDSEHFEVEMHLGEEVLNANFRDEKLSISAAKNKELENEITEKLNEQFKKEYPVTCPQFLRRVYKR